MKQWKKVVWSDESHFLLHVNGRVRVRCLPGEEMAPGCTMGRRQAGRGSVMLWAMFCWETMGPGIHVTSTCTTYLNTVADQVLPFMARIFPDGSGLFQQNNAPCHTAKIVQEWFEEHECWLGLQTPQISVRSNICGMCRKRQDNPWRLHLATYRT